MIETSLRRLLIMALAGATTFAAAQTWADLLGQNGMSGFDRVQVALFALNFGWVSVFFWSALLGWLVRVLGAHPAGLRRPTGVEQLPPRPTPIAVLVPCYNEDAAAVFGRVRAMLEGVSASKCLEQFHFFVLSDTTDPDIWVQEEICFQQTRTQLHAHDALFYRRRTRNTARKAGNIAEFVQVHSGAYEHMIVLDADSLLTASCLLELARTAQLNPQAGIIQALPLVIGSHSLYARAQQFAARLYGPLLAAGIQFWHLGDGNYWGHNAIIRCDLFAAACGLPELPGPPPLGGHILSHDFVEAALIRRAGGQVWLLADVEGSFEQMPQSLIENSKRERRWVQGNLQHSRVLLAAGLHPMSRLHLAMGILAYLAPLMGLLFLFTGLASAIHATLVPPDYFPDSPSLFPIWPIFDGDRALQLLAVVVLMLSLPKLLAVLAPPRGARAWGGRLRLLVSVLAEHLLTLLLAPVTLLIQAGFVLDVLRGRDSGWGAQNRGDARTPWALAWQRHRGHTAFGAALALVSWFFAPNLFWWLSPIIGGLLLAIPLSVYSSRAGLSGLFIIPEERTVPVEWQAAQRYEHELAARLPQPDAHFGLLAAVLDDPALGALHQSLLPAQAVTLANPDELAKARRKLALRATALPPSPLSGPEKLALLLDAQSLRGVPLGLRPHLP